MVEEQLARRGIRDPQVLEAMRRVPREAFVAAEQAEHAYADVALAIRHGQTISQPYMVACMVEALALRPEARVLDVGTGSGYAAAVLAQIAAQVFSIELVDELADEAAARLASLGYEHVRVKAGDGSLGWPEEAPFDGILVSAGAREVPRALLAQLRVGGRLVIPVGTTPYEQQVVVVTRGADGSFEERRLVAARFVPLRGAEGWRDDEA